MSKILGAFLMALCLSLVGGGIAAAAASPEVKITQGDGKKKDKKKGKKKKHGKKAGKKAHKKHGKKKNKK